MEAGRCIINGTDIATLGMFIERDGSNDLLSFPDRRKPDQNDWAEHSGLDVDLEDISFEAKKVRIKYVLIATTETAFKLHLNSFDTLHRTSDYLSVFVAEFSKTFQLRFVGFSDYKPNGGLSTPGRKVARISVDYMMDDPLQLYTTAVSVPVADRGTDALVSINSYDLSRFGIVVREIYASAMIPRSAKHVLQRKIFSQSGLIADTAEPAQKARTIEIACIMLADTLSELMINLSALWANMNSTTAIELTAGGEVMQCYYSKMSGFVKETAFRRKVRVSFKLHLQEI